jgi:stage II sporulation protein R
VLSPPGERVSAAPLSTPITIPHVIRFRVIANSDNPLDQAVKLAVRDRVLNVLDPVLNGLHSRREAGQRIRAMLPRLDEVADAVLVHDHMPYRARVEWTTTLFPTKAYGSWVLPAGRYQALLIILGRGQGHNWWCVLFPSLCFIDMGNALAVPTPAAAMGSFESSHNHGTHRQRKRLSVDWSVRPILQRLLTILGDLS